MKGGDYELFHIAKKIMPILLHVVFHIALSVKLPYDTHARLE